MAQSTRFPSDHVSPASLGEPLKFEFSGLTAKNRFMKAAMSEHLASWDTKNPRPVASLLRSSSTSIASGARAAGASF